MSGAEVVAAEGAILVAQLIKWAVTYYVDLKSGEKGEFDKLIDELNQLKGFLEDSDKVSKDSNSEYEKKVREVRELVHDVEDTIEICMTKKAEAKTKNLGIQFMEKLGTGMAREVKNLRLEKVTPIVSELKAAQAGRAYQQPHGKSRSEKPPGSQYHHGETSTSSEKPPDSQYHQDDQTTTPVMLSNQDEFVNFKDENTIIEYLEKDTEKLGVISIFGMPGIGKTIFASKIYLHEINCGKFPVHIWIPVSQGFNFKDMLLDMVKTLVPKDLKDRPSIGDLISTVKGCLKDTKFLLVMDDVCTVEDWKLIVKILPMDNKQGKVLVTTRENTVATAANAKEKHELLGLEAEESLRLLKLKVFETNPHECTPGLNAIMREIADKCDGMPLVILLIGEIMKKAFVLSLSPLVWKEEWEKVSNNMDKYLKQDKEKIISDVVEMSYKSLPRDLTLCFLYMGLFPENYEIPASELTKLWIAEGFIQPGEHHSIEEAATEILNQLIHKNLLIAAKKNLHHIKTCRVHCMIRAFCLSKAMEENIFRVIGDPGHKLSDEQVKQLRRLCLHSDPSSYLSKNTKGPRVRSFHCFFKDPSQLDTTHVSFSLLRVLNCNSIKFGVFPEIKRLILLKHISLCINQINALPKHIYKLVNLQTLIVDTTSRSIIVKKKIWKMSQLRRFKTTAAISLDDTKGEGKAYCVSLETMSKLSPDSCNVALSKRAPNLKTLGIRGKLANLFVTFSMTDFSTLEKLKLENDLGNESAASSNRSTKMTKMQPALSDNSLCLTQTECFPPNLTKLSLSKTRLKWADHMKILAKIKTLKVLKLKEDALTGNTWRVGQDDVFPELNLLVIENTDLEDWEDLTPLSFPKLRSLRVKNCRLLKAIPGNLAYLDYLETLEIEHVKRSVADSANAIDSFRKQPQDTFRVPFQLIIGPGCTIP